MNEEDKNKLQKVLQESIEVLLEDFEDVTGRQVTGISVSRTEIDEGETGRRSSWKAFEYKVEVKSE